jgi:hypothetical protein
MKPFILATALLLMGCGNKNESAATTKKADTVTSTVRNTDQNDITNALHDFFAWYGRVNEKLSRDFMHEKNKHLVLDEAKMKAYFAEFKQSGFVSDEFIADETKFYQACAKIWQTELVGDVPTGLDADRYFCAQDFVDTYDKAPVTATITGDRAKALLSVAADKKLSFEMKKENGKWLLAKVNCDSGVKY